MFATNFDFTALSEFIAMLELVADANIAYNDMQKDPNFNEDELPW